MKNIRRASGSIGLTLTGIFFGYLLMFAGEQSLAQNTSDNASYDVTFQFYDLDHSATWPVAVRGLFIDGRAIPFDRPVHLEGQWLSKLMVEVQNVSPKTIVRAGLTLRFPETGDGTPSSPFVGLRSTLGTFPDIALYRPDGTKAAPPSYKNDSPISVPPGAVMKFTYALGRNDVLAEAVAKEGSLSKVTIIFGPVFFSDDTLWTAETYQVPSKPPGTWITVSRDNFFSVKQTPKQN